MGQSLRLPPVADPRPIPSPSDEHPTVKVGHLTANSRAQRGRGLTAPRAMREQTASQSTWERPLERTFEGDLQNLLDDTRDSSDVVDLQDHLRRGGGRRAGRPGQWPEADVRWAAAREGGADSGTRWRCTDLAPRGL